MFAIEITFKDGVSQSEMIYVRRPQAVIGSAENAHVVVEDMRGLGYQLSLMRDVRRRFRCKPVGTREGVQVPHMLEGVYDGQATIDVGSVRFNITALDSDLRLRESEPPDRAGVRVLRQACAALAPGYPAVVVRGNPPVVVSFTADQPVFIGRSNQCVVRLEETDISSKHARMGFESGQFWIEDLGSTNGTFVNQQQISGRVTVKPGTPITLGRDVSIMGVTSEEQYTSAARPKSEALDRTPVKSKNYPALVAATEVARPARLIMKPGQEVTIGRVPNSDLWLGAPHVSRKHCVIKMSKTGVLSVADHSTNGTSYDDGVLHKGEEAVIDGPKVLDFGSGVTVGICFDEDQENAFLGSQGSAAAFKVDLVTGTAHPDEGRRKTNHDSLTTSLKPHTFVGLSPLTKAKVMYMSLSLPERMLVVVVCTALPVVLFVLFSMLLRLGG